MLQACFGIEARAGWTGAIKRLVHRYLDDRRKRRGFRRDRSEDRIVARYQGRRWCDATERDLIGDILDSPDSRL